MKADKKENALLKGKVSSQDLIFSVLSDKIKKGAELQVLEQIG